MKWFLNHLMFIGAFCMITLTGSVNSRAQESASSVHPDQAKDADIQKTAQDPPERSVAYPFRKIIIEQPGELAFEAMANLKTMRQSRHTRKSAMPCWRRHKGPWALLCPIKAEMKKPLKF